MENVHIDLNEFLIIRPTASVENQEEIAVRPLGDSPIHWTRGMTLGFLDIYRKTVKLKFKNQKTMFSHICEIFNEQFSMNLTWQQILNKFKSLERSYKDVKDNNNATGRRRKDFEFEEHMDNILGKRRNVDPEILLADDGEFHPRPQKRAPPVTTASNSSYSSGSGVSNSNQNQHFQNGPLLPSTPTSTQHQPRVTIKSQNPPSPSASSSTDNYAMEAANAYLNIDERRTRKPKTTRTDVINEIRKDKVAHMRRKEDMWNKRLEAVQRRNQLLEEKNALLKLLVDRLDSRTCRRLQGAETEEQMPIPSPLLKKRDYINLRDVEFEEFEPRRHKRVRNECYQQICLENESP